MKLKEVSFVEDEKVWFTCIVIFFRPVALAWEIRKSSPGKSLSNSQNKETLKPTDGVSRTLNFTGQK